MLSIFTSLYFLSHYWGLFLCNADMENSIPVPTSISPYHSFVFVEFCSSILIFLLFFIACLSHNGMWAPWEQLICVIRAEILVSRTVPANINIYGQNRAFPGGSVVNNPPSNAGDVKDTGLIPGSGRAPGGGHGSPLQYSCLENPMDIGAWQAKSRGSQSQTWLKWLSMHACPK